MNKFRVAGIQLKFDTTPDLFSPKGIDMGTELLLSCIGKFSYSTSLDWGC
jgi:16S rRNA G1207 methylase RsmC